MLKSAIRPRRLACKPTFPHPVGCLPQGCVMSLHTPLIKQRCTCNVLETLRRVAHISELTEM